MNTHEQSASRETNEQFNEIITEGIKLALDEIKEKYEQAPEEKNRLPFHNMQHSEGVIQRTEQILKAIQNVSPEIMSGREIGVSKLIASHHDTIQDWEENTVDEPQGTKIMRKRFAVKNEQASLDGLIAYLDKTNLNNQQGNIFTEQDYNVAREAITGTVPGFNPEKGTVIQPNLNNNSGIVARAIGLADLGTAGMSGPEEFIREGSALFREENLDILEGMRNPDTLTEQKKEYFKQRMLAWSNFQPTFARGRQQLLDSELSSFPEEVRGAVKELFTQFDASINTAAKVAERRSKMDFIELAKDMGYKYE